MAKELIMMVGLPRSGKSTQAKKMQANLTGNPPIVCPNDIRLQLTGQRFHPPAEGLVWFAARMMVELLFQQYDKVILDATNGTPERRAEWISFHWKVLFHEVHCSVEECKTRAIRDDMEDLLPVIDRMSEAWKWPTAGEAAG